MIPLITKLLMHNAIAGLTPSIPNLPNIGAKPKKTQLKV